MKEVKQIIENSETTILFVLDIWSDSINRDSFLDVTIFYIDENFKINDQ